MVYHQGREYYIRRTAIVIILPWFLVSGLQGCAPSLKTDTLHPDVETAIEFTASRGGVRGEIDKTRIKIKGELVDEEIGDICTYQSPSFEGVSNRKLKFSAEAVKSNGGISRKKDWLFISDPVGDFYLIEPDGEFWDGYPRTKRQQTGPNLFRIDKQIVEDTAFDALDWYATEYNRSHPDSYPLEISDILASPNMIASAITFYVDKNVRARNDEENVQVFDEVLFFNNEPYKGYRRWYRRGGVDLCDLPQPADLTIEISGRISTSVNSASLYYGDCEDRAILRAALLHSLHFRPWAVWQVNNRRGSHEYNITLYEGAYRIMDDGTSMEFNLAPCAEKRSEYRSMFAWNYTHGRRGRTLTNFFFLRTHVNNYPGRKGDRKCWSWKIYFTDIDP